MSIIFQKNTRQNNAAILRQKGFSLVEVLIAVLVIAIGLLGLAGLQSVGVNSNHISYLRSVASIHTENMAELMRANIVAVVDNDYAQNAAPATVDYDAIAMAVEDGNQGIDCRANQCTPDQQAQSDAFNWLTAIARDLPTVAGVTSGVVTCNDNNLADADGCSQGSTYSITVSWQEKNVRDNAANQFTTQSFSTVFRP